jgi:hypothetical protein
VIAGESTHARWGQWWRMASAIVRLRREVNELRATVDKLDARVDELDALVHNELALTDAALEKMRHDFDFALSQNKRRCDMYRIGWWHDLAPGGRSRPTVEYFGAGDFQKLMMRLAELRTGGNHAVVEVAGIGKWRRVSL